MNVLLGITGGVAAFKTASLVRALRERKMSVRVVMTKAATAFMTPLMLQALSGHPVRVDLFDTEAENAMGHIEFARWADILVIAPATAHCIAKLAQGLADDLLTTLALVFDGPTLICPSMNHSMWHHRATIENCERLRQRKVHFLGPNEGEQACGEYGFGRMAEVDEIVTTITHLTMTPQSLKGYHVIITAGPTREAIDPVRYLSNYSSGKMGFALVEAALLAGASVTLISGPTTLPVPDGVILLRVESAEEMYQASMSALKMFPQSIFIGAAAVADYCVKTPAYNKLKKSSSSLTLELALNRDIVSDVAKSKQASFVVGFAAETEDVLTYAKEKLAIKKLDMIVANRVGRGLGFEVDENEVVVLTPSSTLPLARASKKDIAVNLIAIIATSLQNAHFNIAESRQEHATNSTN